MVEILVSYSINELEKLLRYYAPNGEVKLVFSDKGVEFYFKLSRDPDAWSRFLSLEDFVKGYYEEYPDEKIIMEIPVPGATRSNVYGNLAKE